MIGARPNCGRKIRTAMNANGKRYTYCSTTCNPLSDNVFTAEAARRAQRFT